MSDFKNVSELKASIKLVDYASYCGYKIDKHKSTRFYIVMKNEVSGDKILVAPGKGRDNEDLYMSVIDKSNDAGDVIQFCQNRMEGGVSKNKSKESFYNTLVELNKFTGVIFTPDLRNRLNKNHKYLEKKDKLIHSQDFNAVPIHDYSYFTNERLISLETLQNPLIKDRLFNSYFITEHKHIFTNYCFGTYKKDKLVGLEIKTKSRKYNVSKENDTGVFISDISSFTKLDLVFYCESGVDLLSYLELLPTYPNYDASKNMCFISTGGFLYPDKMDTIFEHLDDNAITENTKFISITDNDAYGNYADLFFTAALLNKYITPVTLTKLEKTFHVLKFSDSEFVKTHYLALKDCIDTYNNTIQQQVKNANAHGSYIVLKKKENELEINLPYTFKISDPCFKNILKICDAQRLYIPHKAKYDDWNTSLQNYKKQLNFSAKIQDNIQKKKSIKI